MDLTEAEIRAQQSSNQRKTTSAQNQLNSIQSRLAKVRAAKSQVARLKASADEAITLFKQLDFKDTAEWKGSKRNAFEGKHADSNQTNRNYYLGLDNLADDLESAERKLLQDRSNYTGIIRRLESIALELREQLNQLFN